MIRVKLGVPNKLPPSPISSQSAFIEFDYDSVIIDKIKSLSTRVYLPDSRTWEIPVASLPTLCDNLAQYDIEITGTVEKEKKITAKLPDNFTWHTTPYTHQIEGVLHGLEKGTFLLGDDQGLGKTHQIINIARAMKLRDGIKRCLIICGINSTKYNWSEEVATHSEEKSWVLGTRYTKKYPIRQIEGSSQDKLDDLNNLPDAFFIITNIETLRQLHYKKGTKTIYPVAQKIQELCLSGEIGMIAVDEIHKCKNPDSKQGRALLTITAPGIPKIPMSGTFVLNNPLDLFLPLSWTGFEQHSFYQYKMHFCNMGGYGGREIVGYKNLDELRTIMSQVMLRRTKEDALDLPPKVHTTEYVEMGKEQSKVYNEVREAIKENIDRIKIHNDPLTQMIRLRQATGYPGILSTTIKDSAKMDRLEELMEEIKVELLEELRKWQDKFKDDAKRKIQV